MQLLELLADTDAHLLTVAQAIHLALQSAEEFQRELGEARVIVIKASPEGIEDGASPSDHDRIAAAESVAGAVEVVMATAQRAGFRCQGVVGVGAFTIARVVKALGGITILPTADTDPHIPIASIATGDWAGLKVAMKGGLIGGRRALLDLISVLRSGT